MESYGVEYGEDVPLFPALNAVEEAVLGEDQGPACLVVVAVAPPDYNSDLFSRSHFLRFGTRVFCSDDRINKASDSEEQFNEKKHYVRRHWRAQGASRRERNRQGRGAMIHSPVVGIVTILVAALVDSSVSFLVFLFG